MTKKLSRSEQMVAEKTICIMLVKGESAQGVKIYAYVAVRADKIQDFMKAQAAGTFNPEDFGTVIEQGEGEPSGEVKEKMTREYGFNHEAMIDIPDTIKAEQLTEEIIATAKPPAAD